MRPRLKWEEMTPEQQKRRLYYDANKEHLNALNKKNYWRRKEEEKEMAKTPEGRRWLQKMKSYERMKKHDYYASNRQRLIKKSRLNYQTKKTI